MNVVLTKLFRRALFLKILTTFSTYAAVFLLAAPTAWADPDWATMLPTKYSDMQAVDSTGASTWTIPLDDEPPYDPGYKLIGIVLNNPDDMLDSTANYIPCDDGTLWQLGGQWQVCIQTTATDPQIDFGGATLFMAQNYGNVITHWPDSDYSYNNDEWNAEIARVSLSGTLQAGDLVEIHARGGLFYKGKFNVNEQHDKDTSLDFEVIPRG
ncbi:MAG: hypothetical protein ACWGMZ_08840, partial [Thermoguttaceae bacterium]